MEAATSLAEKPAPIVDVEALAKRFATDLLGDKKNIYAVKASNVFGNKWRVNVYKKATPTAPGKPTVNADVFETVTMPNSYFLKYDNGAFTVVA